MMSVAPGERVPRHRLIRNLIEIGEFDQAQTEIRIFEKDFKSDGPVARYKVKLMVARATRTEGILREDRLAILKEAEGEAIRAVRRYENNPQVFYAYCDVGLALLRVNGDASVYEAAMAALKEAESRIGDPQITRKVRSFERRVAMETSDESMLEENDA